MGEVIHGYELLGAFSTVDSGSARWCFAQKGGAQFFLKEFLSPVFPMASAEIPGERRASLIKFCNAFEARKNRLYASLRAANNGNIVAIQDFFCERGKYYCVTEKVATDSALSPSQISLLPLNKRQLILKILTHSMVQLENRHIVHADLKPTNVLLKPTTNGFYTLKLIDFDESFFEDEASSKDPDELKGDPVYLAPEMFLAMAGEDVALTTKVDVFAMGLLMHQFLCGRLPGFDRNISDYAYEAVLQGEKLVLDPRLGPASRALMEKMLSREPEQRPSFADVLTIIGGSPVPSITSPMSSPPVPPKPVAPCNNPYMRVPGDFQEGYSQ